MHNFQIFKNTTWQVSNLRRLASFKNVSPVTKTETTSITRSFLCRSTEQTDHQEIIMLTFERRVAFLHPAEKQINISVHRKKLSLLDFL